jgi:hypothetical protein
MSLSVDRKNIMTGRCPHCNAYAVPLPNPLWKVAHAAAWGYAATSVLGASLIGPMIIGIVPVLLFGGVCAISETHRRAHAVPECEACGRYASAAVPEPQPHFASAPRHA